MPVSLSLRRTFVLGVGLTFGAASCGHKHDQGSGAPAAASVPPPAAAPTIAPVAPPQIQGDALTDPAPLSGYQLSWWQDKVSRTLTGKDLDHQKGAKALTSASRLALVDALLKEGAFADVVARFNFFFLGFRRDSIHDDKGFIAADAIAQPAAIAAARTMTEGGDYLQILNLNQPNYLAPLGTAYLFDPNDPNGTKPQPSQKDIRTQLRTKILAAAAGFAAAANGKGTLADLCTQAQAALNGTGVDNIYSYLSFYGIPNNLTNVVESTWLLEPLGYCFGQKTGTAAEFAAAATAFSDKMTKFMALVDSADPSVYQPKSLAQIRVLDDKELNLGGGSALTQNFYVLLQNSSTNHDRRRGAYMLDRYFCDNLTPIAVEQPTIHAEGKHAEDPSCQSCHYKLDPMAGFFKDIGVFGTDFSGQPQIEFDDFASVDLPTYEQSWLAPAASGRKWDIGYVRSSTDPKANTYGQTLPDLFKIIGQAPEARQCLVRRMFEFFVGEDQAIDPGYLDFLTDRFNDDAKKDSALAFKHTVARLVLGGTFAQADPVSNECYDEAPGVVAQDRPPCRVSFILQKSCASCHSGKQPSAGLDLTHWVKAADGQTFPHLLGGQQASRRDTIQHMYDRVTTTDKDQRMPLGQDMPNADREQLVLWLQDEQQQIAGGQ